MKKLELIREEQTGRVLHHIAMWGCWLGAGISLVTLITRSDLGGFITLLLGVFLGVSLIFSLIAGVVLTNTLKKVLDGRPDAGMIPTTRLTEQSLVHAAISWERVQRPDERIDGVAFYTATGQVAKALRSVVGVISAAPSGRQDPQRERYPQ